MAVERTVYQNSISDKQTFWYFNIMYAFALVVTAAIAIFSQMYVQRQLTSQLDDGRVINLAGKQRMYCQQIVKLGLFAKHHERPYAEIEKQLKASLVFWTHTHGALLNGSDSLGLPTNQSEIIHRMTDVIQPPFETIKERGELMVTELRRTNPDSSVIGRHLEVMMANESHFSRGMDAIVLQFEVQAQENVNYLKQIELLSLMLILVTLLLEVMIIFHPTAKRIKRIISNLIQSEKHAQEISTKLTELNISLEKSNKEVKDINFALNEATILIRTNEYGIITFANEKYSEVTKYAQNELLGKRLFENHVTGQESIIYGHINDPVRRTSVWQGEIYDHAKDGSFFWLDVTLIPIISKEGILYQYLVICSNITKRKQTENELERVHQAQLEHQRNEKKITSYAIISGQEKERKRMSQEIHDGIGQMLTALKFGVEAMNVNGSEKEAERVDSLKGQLHNIIREVRRISSDLLPSVLNDFGLFAAIKDLVKTLNNNSEVPIYLEVPEGELPLDKHMETSLYRITQEALNNSLKYSEATEIRVKLTNDIEFLQLRIEDNGKGFELEHTLKNSKSVKTGNGLANMQERAELINGKLLINSNPGEGTLVYVEVPLEQAVYGEN